MKFLKWLSGQFFPENYTCELCGKEVFKGERICEECLPQINFNDGTTCPVCGRKTLTDALCVECKALAPKYTKAVSALVYEDGGQKLIFKFKNGSAYLNNYFIDLLVDKCAQFSHADGICCVPMTAKSKRKRGYNQSELLAKALSERIGVPYLKNAVTKTKDTAAQKSLSLTERSKNLKNTFHADGKIVNGKTLIVVDDVMTTGATAEAICSELIKRGAAKIYFVSAASVEYKTDK